MLNWELCINDPLCLFLAYIIIKWGTVLTELCLLGNKNANSIWIKMAMGKPIAALIIRNQITKLITKQVYEKYFQGIG